MLIYIFLKNYARLFLSVIYRKVYYINQELLPSSKNPVIFAVNHPTAFTDSFVFMVYTHFNCHFMLRGDFFKVSPFIRWLMDQIRLIPVFRQRDGFSNMRQNQTLFELFYDLLKKRNSISIMVEGSHDHRKRLRPVQRGTARIVIGALKKYEVKDTIIVPIGLTYSNPTQFRSTVAIKVNDPIHLKDYLEAIEQNERKAMLAVTAEIEERMQPCLVHVAEETDDKLVDQLLELQENDLPLRSLPAVSTDPKSLNAAIKLAQQINELETTSKLALKDAVHQYFTNLTTLKLKDKGVIKSRKFNFWNTLFVLLGLPFYLVAYISHFIPLQIAITVTKKMKKPEFIASMMLVAAMFSFLIYWLIMLIVGLILWEWWSIGIALALPVVAYLGLLFRDFLLDWNATRKFESQNKSVKADLLNQRNSIKQMLSTVSTKG